ncbi:MAG: hypothetical protein ACYDH6_23985 [Acidimicrobiales bacterium]
MGAFYAFALLSLPSIGLFVLPVPIIATIILARQERALSGAAGLLSGCGLPLLYVAWINRGGPGDVCTPHSCVQEYNPWAWFAASAVAILAGLIVFIAPWRRRSR